MAPRGRHDTHGPHRCRPLRVLCRARSRYGDHRTNTRTWRDLNGDYTIYNGDGSVQYDELGPTSNVNFGKVICFGEALTAGRFLIELESSAAFGCSIRCVGTAARTQNLQHAPRIPFISPRRRRHEPGDRHTTGVTIARMEGGDEVRSERTRAARLTYDDLVLFEADGLRHELIDGEHYVTPSPNTRHQRLVGRLFAAFVLYLRDHPEAGEAFLAPFDVVFTDYDVVEPDLLFVASDQSGIVTDKHVRGAPAIVIEILSPGTRKADEKIKYRLFERNGVREYWIVDPELDVVKVCRRAADGSLPRVEELSADAAETLTTPLLPGLAIPLRELFR
jgi:Uma2 family endonuclease